MKQRLIMMQARVLAASLFALGVPAVSWAKAITIVSNGTWKVTDSSGNPKGRAQPVCLNCATGATAYGYPLPAWTADLSAIPGARWIWAPGIDGKTSPAANTEFTFHAVFYLCGSPKQGSNVTIFLAADNFAEVFLNGVSVATSTDPNAITGPIILPAPAMPSPIAQGQNLIDIKVKNGPNPGDCAIDDQYHCNPAGFVFGATFEDALAAWPTCTGDNGTVFNVGDMDPRSCPPGTVGSASRVCICLFNMASWYDESTCVPPPPPSPTCIGDNGHIFNVGDVEQLPCPPGLTGSASRTCENNGNNGRWGPTNSTTCVLPPKTCTGSGGTTFTPGQSETLACDADQIGSKTHTCQTDGSWGPISSTCKLPVAGLGDKCGARDRNPAVFATCPTGIECLPRRIGDSDRPSRPPTLWTADWYCGDWNSKLGESCTYNGQCVSGYCDGGWGTSNTRKCMPRGGTGRAGDPCSNNNQCSSGVCGGLQQLPNGTWRPGNCN